MNLFDITGKVIVITGGGGALGGGIAKSLLQAGARVVILSRRQSTVDNALAEMSSFGEHVLGIACDVLDESSLKNARDQVKAKWEKIDVLINAAGGNMPGATIGLDQTIFDLKLDDFRAVTDLNLTGTVLPSMVFGKEMADSGKGVIINFSSMAAQQAITRVVGYSAAKASIDNFTKWMAVEMATKFGEGIRVNAVAPGFFIGEQNRRLLTNEDGTLTDRGKTIIANTPMKRFGEAEELCGTVHWLCSEASKFVTGIVVPVDGGFSAFSGV
ncbi:SDR family oxidoreductase [Limibacter armeniacum]|uniref:SDR family oxidoreductase n=1 Tax=Limibacter armeniacum TaxID=466084 RepID=UPI002FE69AF5